MNASTHDAAIDLSAAQIEAAQIEGDTEFERELRVRLAEAENTAARAEAEGEHELADAMRSHADDLRRTAVLHAVPAQPDDPGAATA